MNDAASSLPADATTQKEGAVGTDLFGPGQPGDRTYLLGSSCPSCGRAEFPQRAECPACGTKSVPVHLAGPTRLRVSTAVLAQPPGSRVEAPYGVGVAEFPQGLCVIGLLVGEPPVGTQVDVVVHEPYDGGRTFAFRESASVQGADSSLP